jgi:hypothetical protein
MNIRIFRQPTKDIQPNGEFYIDKLQYQVVFERVTTEGVSGIKTYTPSDWMDVPIVEADSY